MTEQRFIENIECSINNLRSMYESSLDKDITYLCAIQALEEVQKFRAIGLTPELADAMHGHNVALINQVEEIRIKTIEEFANALKNKCDIAIESKMNKNTYPSLSDAYEYFKDDIEEVANELKATDPEDVEEKDTDCIIKHLTRECSYNETGCSGCKGKERIKIALEKSEAKKPVDITRVKDGDNFVGYIGKCPHCGAIVDENDNVSYCDCGQKLAWSEVY